MINMIVKVCWGGYRVQARFPLFFSPEESVGLGSTTTPSGETR